MSIHNPRAYYAIGFIEPRDLSVGIMREAFLLEQLKPAEPGLTQADADRLCDELCDHERNTKAAQDYRATEDQILDALYDEDDIDYP